MILAQKLILPGTKIITDGWKAYKTLEQGGYIHGVNHSIEFINSNMQKIEVMEIFKEWTKNRGQPRENDNMYIFQFIYFYKQKNQGNKTPRQIFSHFLQDIATVYPGYGKQGLCQLLTLHTRGLQLVMNKWQYSVTNIKADKCGYKSC